jgi:hypothetical protein
MELFKQSLVRYFSRTEPRRAVVFMETAMDASVRWHRNCVAFLLAANRPHTSHRSFSSCVWSSLRLPPDTTRASMWFPSRMNLRETSPCFSGKLLRTRTRNGRSTRRYVRKLMEKTLVASASFPDRCSSASPCCQRKQTNTYSQHITTPTATRLSIQR